MGAFMAPFSIIWPMQVTAYLIIFILGVVAVTYPKEFPTLIRDPKMLTEVISLELKRRWMIVKLRTQIWISRQQLNYSHWRMAAIIKSEKQKQQQEETTEE